MIEWKARSRSLEYAITRLYGASRLFVNFFQPSFKLASKHRDGAKVTKRYHPPLTPCDRLLQTEGIPSAAKDKLREVSALLDPLKLMEEMRAVQAYLTALADGETPPTMATEPPNLATFVASLSSAWRDGEVRPTFSLNAKPRVSPWVADNRSPCSTASAAEACDFGDANGSRQNGGEAAEKAASGLRRAW
jgi:hypothetical protein